MLLAVEGSSARGLYFSRPARAGLGCPLRCGSACACTPGQRVQRGPARERSALRLLQTTNRFLTHASYADNYGMGGQDWGTYPKTNTTGKGCNATLYGSQLQANGYAACLVTVDNTACTNTQNSIQSPIDIPIESTTLVVYNTTLKPLNINYGTTTSWTMEVQSNYLEVADIKTAVSTANALGDGSTADGLAGTGADGLTLPDGTFLPLNQFHMHTPSENTINGQYYPMEMHLVRLVRMRRASFCHLHTCCYSTSGAQVVHEYHHQHRHSGVPVPSGRPPVQNGQGRRHRRHVRAGADR